MIKKVLLGLLCVVLVGLLGFGILQSMREDQAKALALEEINERLEPLRSRKLELEAELAGLKRENDEQMGGMATLSLLVTDLSGDFVAQIAPLLETAEVPAVMVLSQEQFPGNEGLITVEEFRQLLENGWDYCTAWDGSIDFSEWYINMAQRLKELGFAMPESLYCAERSYTADLEKAAQVQGITTLVHSGEKNLPIVDTEHGTPWRLGSIRWIASGGRNCLEQAIEKHGSMVFVIDQMDFYESEFKAMLNLVKRYQGEETLMAGTLAEAGTYREEVIAQQEKMQNEAYEARVRELNEEIEAVLAEIQGLLTKQ